MNAKMFSFLNHMRESYISGLILTITLYRIGTKEAEIGGMMRTPNLNEVRRCAS